MLGTNPRRLGAGTHGAAFLNAADNVVIKYCFDYEAFVTCVNEVGAMLVP